MQSSDAHEYNLLILLSQNAKANIISQDLLLIIYTFKKYKFEQSNPVNNEINV